MKSETAQETCSTDGSCNFCTFVQQQLQILLRSALDIKSAARRTPALSGRLTALEAMGSISQDSIFVTAARRCPGRHRTAQSPGDAKSTPQNALSAYPFPPNSGEKEKTKQEWAPDSAAGGEHY